MWFRATALAAAGIWVFVGPAQAADLKAAMQLATPTGPGDAVGTVTVRQHGKSTQFLVNLHGLQPGPHGFHVHDGGSCAPTTVNNAPVPAGAAGGHYDPEHTGHHGGPQGPGHLGDLPVLTVGAKGTARTTLTAPRITDASVLKGHALMIHAGGDNYADDPMPLGGGGARLACGVIQ